jgi:histidyl-tRNA synthetase
MLYPIAMTGPAKQKSVQAPKGTRDLYPLEAARRRFITETWRRAAIRHGFEEVDGPTFEALELYTVKSGEGIVSELFQAFSGKSPEEVEQVRGTGQAPFALRPEFTPTLARMYAARASSLPKPTKWFSIGPFFRAERPQRGRLREFLQLNVDVIGTDVSEYAEGAEGSGKVAESKARMDAECIGCCIGVMESFGLGPEEIRVRINSRHIMADWMRDIGLPEVQFDDAFFLLDRIDKLDSTKLLHAARERGIKNDEFEAMLTDQRVLRLRVDSHWDIQIGDEFARYLAQEFEPMIKVLRDSGLSEWCDVDTSIVRGLAYYTGTVFEVVPEGERALFGGGRYDNLIELFGGPRTPAVGFAMGDVVLSLLLQDKGLMPSDEELMERAGERPDVFVFAAREELDGAAAGLIARLRRGGEDVGALHVRRSYKSTRNVGKLLKEAAGAHARFAVVVESEGEAMVKDLDHGEQERVVVGEVGGWIRGRIV